MLVMVTVNGPFSKLEQNKQEAIVNKKEKGTREFLRGGKPWIPAVSTLYNAASTALQS